MNLPRKPVAEYIKTLNRFNSQAHAFTSVTLFLEFIYNWKRAGIRLTDDDREYYETLAVRYLREQRDYQKDVTKYLQSYKGRSNSAYTRLSILKCFLHEYGINIDKAEVKRKIPKRWQKTQSPDMDIDLIKKLLIHSDELMRAIILLNLSSGIRIGETLRLRYQDINPVEGLPIYRIRIDGEESKTGRERFTYCTQEAMDAINEYLLVKNRIFKEKRREEPFNNTRDVGYLFPLCRSSVNNRFARILKRADLYAIDPVTGKCTIHLHLLRGMFFSHLVASGCPIGIAEHFIHHQGNNDYGNYTQKQQAEAYYKACYSLITDFDTETKRMNAALINRNEKLQLENINIKMTNEELQKQVTTSLELLLPLLKERNNI